ncbi:ERF family protein [Ideonella livida]|uniref:ERF family protein n=1 Tax=Ideonella livida TaxID=2707176 RepID=A0A7C9TIF1_9BURK|nr:ERF family protein [Ideonella livida]NDY89765.1 ERF family protein [Ideonella livida]
MNNTANSVVQAEPCLPATQPASPAFAGLDLIAKAVERGCSSEQIDQLAALAERMARDAKKAAWSRAMAAFSREPIEVLKNKTADFPGKNGRVSYNFADLTSVTDAIRPAMAKHGLFYRWEERTEGTTVHCTCYVGHADGHEEKGSTLSAPKDDSGSKNTIQASGSTISYLRRYTLLGFFGLAPRDGADDDGRTAAPTPGTQAKGAGAAEEAVDYKRNLEACRNPQALARVMNGIPSSVRQKFLPTYHACLAVLQEAAA